ncbi:hypothetical protein H7T43_09125 [Peribacillus simplex]|uniref:hypothetical protein n=1 Tax=Peribacillus simplex TaxID=1478 RepID=UPI002989CC6D|nr:hypothetical protein [Peribacillus simplex]MBX9955078.1 hypothetical protein [Peribacillus simplex]
MTAEIAILNRMGVALAADSAVTIGSNLTQKVYNSANKLFSLSKQHPVGIMVYGSADFMGVPWETIIKVYRKELGDKKFDTLSEYCESFFSYLKHSEQLIPQYAEDSQVIKVFNSYLNPILNEMDEEIRQSYPDELPSDEEVLAILKGKIDSLISDFTEVPFLKGFSNEFLEEFKCSHKKNITSVVTQNVFIELDEAILESFLELSALMFSKEIISDKMSGVVISGYGEKEIFPSIFEYETEGMFCGLIKMSLEYHIQISSQINEEQTTATIRAFAQKEMVETFMHGIDPRMERAIHDVLEVSLEDKYPSLVAETLGIDLSEEQKEKLRILGNIFNEEFYREINRIKRGNFIYPIVDTVDLLPKEELAAMAEALVNLTSFKRKVSTDAETVGGPIDVAVISKGDGFVWIKRKHYFKPELNYHFFQNNIRG